MSLCSQKVGESIVWGFRTIVRVTDVVECGKCVYVNEMKPNQEPFKPPLPPLLLPLPPLLSHFQPRPPLSSCIPLTFLPSSLSPCSPPPCLLPTIGRSSEGSGRLR